VKVPLTPAAFGVVTGAGVDGVVPEVVVPVEEVVVVVFFVDFVVAFLVDFFVDFLVVTGVEVGAVVAGVGVAAAVAGVVVVVVVVVVVPPAKEVVPPESEVVPPPSEVPLPRAKPVVDPNCGGVIASTAPSPPTVPPAIKKKRLLNIFTPISLTQLSEIQILHCGIYLLEYPHRAQLCARFRPIL